MTLLVHSLFKQHMISWPPRSVRHYARLWATKKKCTFSISLENKNWLFMSFHEPLWLGSWSSLYLEHNFKACDQALWLIYEELCHFIKHEYYIEYIAIPQSQLFLGMHLCQPCSGHSCHDWQSMVTSRWGLVWGHTILGICPVNFSESLWPAFQKFSSV